MRRELVLGLLLASACAPRPAAEQPAPRTNAEVALGAALQRAEMEAIGKLPAGHGRELVMGSCLICHGAGLIVQQHKDAAAWTRTLRQMVSWGAPLPGTEEAALASYLAESFGPVAPPPTP
jgi:cytochrome c5